MKEGSGDGVSPITFIRTHFLDPGQRVHLHERIRDADDVHPVQHALREKQALGGRASLWGSRGRTTPEGHRERPRPAHADASETG